MSSDTHTSQTGMFWLDIETTGLDETELGAEILEVGYIITDNALNIVRHGSWIIQPTWMRTLDHYDSFIQQMHGPNGTDLFSLVRSDSAVELEVVQRKVIDAIDAVFGEDKPPLCGSSVHFDRRWILEFMPNLHDRLHYRNIDISSVLELVRRWGDGREVDDPKKLHRVDDDLDDTLALAALYRDVIQRGCS